jgi:DNA-binding MarR family transcriptional regulator
MFVEPTPNGRMTADRLLENNTARLRESLVGFEDDELEDLIKARGKLFGCGGE